jgi:ketosteroid isomerase-like protein
MKTRTILRALLASAILAVSLPTFAEFPVSPGFAAAQPQTDAQRAMLQVVQRWHDTYNTDVEKMILETYAKEADVFFTGASAHGHDQFMTLEKAIKAKVPGRHMRIDHLYFIGDDRAVVEAVILDSARPDFYSPWCAILEIRDGKIVTDRTYLEPTRWPGIEVAEGLVTPGGLGAP